jgi:pimeloyl-ACP methyl ester carboxylesterase
MGYNVLAVDLRAHGESDGVYSTAGYFEQHDVDAVINQLRALRPHETQELVLFGISLGAAVALGVANLRDDLDAIVLECPYSDFSHAVEAHGRIMNMPGEALQPLALKLAEWLSGATFAAMKPAALVRTAKCPVLVIHGCADELVSPQDMDAFAKGIAARDPALGIAEHWKIAGAGHVTGVCADPEEYRRKIAEFLEAATEASGNSRAPSPRSAQSAG